MVRTCVVGTALPTSHAGVLLFSGGEAMEGVRLAPLPHHSWLGFTFTMPPATGLVVEHRETTHTLVIGNGGPVDVRWIRREHERGYRHGRDQIAFFACDHEVHTHVVRTAGVPSSAYLLKIPTRHLGELAASDEADAPGECLSFTPREDSVLRDCLRLLAAPSGREVAEDIGSEIAARRLVLRLSELLGGRKPHWRTDTSVFTAQDMKLFVDYIDSRLHHHVCLGEIAAIAGLSPSHFARKFRNTAGVSLCRFINRRRVAAAMRLLKTESPPLSRLSLDLGFSSQSHFTRLFSDLTGVSPSRYRKYFKRAMG